MNKCIGQCSAKLSSKYESNLHIKYFNDSKLNLKVNLDIVDMTEISLGVVVAVLCIIILITVIAVVLLRRFVG